MTYKETLQVMAVLKIAYPSYYKGGSDLEQAAALWAELFTDDDALIVASAVKAFIVNDEKGFPPSIGQIKNLVRSLTTEKEMTEIEAWEMVSKALRNSGYNSREEYEKLPPIIQQLIGSPETLRNWAQMDSENVHTVIASNFQRSYRERAKSEREFLALPQSTRNFLLKLAGKFDMQNALGNGKEDNE